MKHESAITISLMLLLILSQVFALVGADSVAGAPDSWTAKAPGPWAHDDMAGGAAVVNGTIYVFSGGGNYFYDPVTGNWSEFAPMPTPMAAFAVAACDNEIYVMGEVNPFQPPLNNAVNEVYDPATNTWATKASMPIATSGAQANTVNGKIYVIGGFIVTAGTPPYTYAHPTVNVTEIYDPVADSWTIGAPMPYPVNGYASAVVDNKIYVMGGQDEYNYPDINVTFNQIYDPASDSWSLGAPMPVSTFSAAAGATTGAEAPRRIYVVGGESGFAVGLDQNYAYDPAANNWTAAAPMPSARYSPTVAVVDDVLYVIGGGQGRTTAATNEQYIPIGYGTPDPLYVLEHIPPAITLLSPLNQTYNQSSVSLVFTVNKPVNWTEYSFDGKQNVTLTGNTTITGLHSGLHNITVYANDTFGNIGGSQTITFTVALPTFPTAIVVAVSISVAVVAVAGLLVYFKRRKRVLGLGQPLKRSSKEKWA